MTTALSYSVFEHTGGQRRLHGVRQSVLIDFGRLFLIHAARKRIFQICCDRLLDINPRALRVADSDRIGELVNQTPAITYVAEEYIKAAVLVLSAGLSIGRKFVCRTAVLMLSLYKRDYLCVTLRIFKYS